MSVVKQRVHDFWNQASCGEDLYLKSADRVGYEAQSRLHYELEPYIFDLAWFDEAGGKQVLEIGVGLGADHQVLQGRHLIAQQRFQTEPRPPRPICA